MQCYYRITDKVMLPGLLVHYMEQCLLFVSLYHNTRESTVFRWMESGMALSLEDFLVRARVLKLYRHALRVSRRAPSHARGDLRQIIRQEMENNRNCNDKQRIRFLISDGLERVKRLDETLDMQGH